MWSFLRQDDPFLYSLIVSFAHRWRQPYPILIYCRSLETPEATRCLFIVPYYTDWDLLKQEQIFQAFVKPLRRRQNLWTKLILYVNESTLANSVFKYCNLQMYERDQRWSTVACGHLSSTTTDATNTSTTVFVVPAIAKRQHISSSYTAIDASYANIAPDDAQRWIYYGFVARYCLHLVLHIFHNDAKMIAIDLTDQNEMFFHQRTIVDDVSRNNLYRLYSIYRFFATNFIIVQTYLWSLFYNGVYVSTDNMQSVESPFPYNFMHADIYHDDTAIVTHEQRRHLYLREMIQCQTSLTIVPKPIFRKSTLTAFQATYVNHIVALFSQNVDIVPLVLGGWYGTRNKDYVLLPSAENVNICKIVKSRPISGLFLELLKGRENVVCHYACALDRSSVLERVDFRDINKSIVWVDVDDLLLL